ncbi:general substrate transporter [Massarina eburnea CBS 473.64]|uniref:Quinate transporter n=1 Tax=Massarina eburnea CBS 473.64 TaxID=1395130 RepID=A0A6A6SD74_9PLEO|nr:general substrate transporter [Massarina eburnea CBS 473.64]
MKNPFTMERDPSPGIPNHVYGPRPYILAFSAAWASAMYGYDSAFIGGTLALPSFKRRFGLDKVSTAELTNLSSNIVSTFQAGAFFGAIIGFFVAERWGRKPVILGGGTVFMIGVGFMLHGTLEVLYAGRALTGLAIGATSTMVPVYISECSPALIRGRLVGVFEIMLQTALVFGFWINYGVEKNISSSKDIQWHIPVAVQFIPAGFLLLSMPFMVESPRWLVSRNRISQATKALCWVRNLPAENEYIKSELEGIQASINHELEVSGGRRSTIQIFREIGAPGIRNRVIIAVLLMVLQNLTGINAINYYSPTILKSVGYTGTSVGLLATGIYGLVKMLTTLVFMVFFVDRFGRRPALLVGAAGAMVAMFYLAGYSKMSGSFDGKSPPQDSGSQAALAMVYIYAIFYGFSWNGIPWIFASEVLPNRVRTLGMMCAVCMQWLAQFIVVYSLPHMIIGITYGTFIFFGSCTVLAFIFAYLFVPETKGVSLEDMDLMFGNGAPLLARAARKRYLEAHEAGINTINVSAIEGKTDANYVDDA